MMIGDKIKLLRTSNQLSQESLAALLDVSRQSISKWEQGISKPSTEKLIRVSEIFKISVEDLMNEDLQMRKYYESVHYFHDVLSRKSIYIPICTLFILFVITFIISVYLKSIQYDKNIIFIIISMSGIFCFLAYVMLLSTLLKYVYLDCKLRGIKPFVYVLISITVIGFAYYLLRRDEITKFD